MEVLILPNGNIEVLQEQIDNVVYVPTPTIKKLSKISNKNHLLKSSILFRRINICNWNKQKSTRLREFHTSFSNDSWAFGEVPWFCHQGTIATNVPSDPFAQISIKCPLWDNNSSMIKATEWWAGYKKWESIKCQINILPPPPFSPSQANPINNYLLGYFEVSELNIC